MKANSINMRKSHHKQIKNSQSKARRVDHQMQFLKKATNHKNQIKKINQQLKKKITSIQSVYKNSYTYQYKQDSKKRYEIIPTAQNYEQLYDRRENLLNSKYNTRKNTLINITKNNKKIHYRINSQESSYSARKFDASYQIHKSRCSSISRSRSKINADLHNSRSSHSNGTSRVAKSHLTLKNNKIKSKSTSCIKLKPLNVNQIDKAEEFLSMFGKPSSYTRAEKQSMEEIKKKNEENLNYKNKMLNQDIFQERIEEDSHEQPLKIKKVKPLKESNINERQKKNKAKFLNEICQQKAKLSLAQAQKKVNLQNFKNLCIKSHQTSISDRKENMKKIKGGLVIHNYYH